MVGLDIFKESSSAFARWRHRLPSGLRVFLSRLGGATVFLAVFAIFLPSHTLANPHEETCKALFNFIGTEDFVIFVYQPDGKSERTLLTRASLEGSRIKSFTAEGDTFISQDQIDFDRSYRLARHQKHPLFNVSSGNVSPSPATEVDRMAILNRDGFQIFTDLPKFEWLTDKDLYKLLYRHYGRYNRVTFYRISGVWYRRKQTEFIKQNDGTVTKMIIPIIAIERLDELAPFFEYVDLRQDFINRVNNLSLNSDGVFELRLDEYFMAAPRFHFDGGRRFGLVEAFNLGPEAQGTFGVGKNNNVFEVGRGESLVFAQDETPGVPPFLHSAPPKTTKRIFTRYSPADFDFIKTYLDAVEIEIRIDKED